MANSGTAEKILKETERAGFQLRLASDRRTIRWASPDGRYNDSNWIPIGLSNKARANRWAIVELLLADETRIDSATAWAGF
jgi:hypothetical protein